MEDEIRRGVRRETLPGERELAGSLQVSRRTVRAALALLRQRKLLQTAQGAETKILAVPKGDSGSRAMRSVGLLMPEPLQQLQPFAHVFFDSLRTLLYENGFRVDLHVGLRYYSARPSAALRRLTTHFPCEGWLLFISSPPVQAWFLAERIPAVVVGTAHEGLALPYVDIDMLATARHAAGVLLRKGHRRLALIIQATERAGDFRTEQGFLQAIRQSGSNAAAQVFRHAGTLQSLQRLTEQILRLPERPTALFIANPYHYLAINGILAQQGLRIPEDMSMLCRDDDFCLRYLPTAPSRYFYNSNQRARAIFANLIWALQRKPPIGEARGVLIQPEFYRGASIATLNP